MKYEPIGNNILVEAIAISKTIQLPTLFEAEQYTVIARGDKTSLPLKAGDVVILAPGAALVNIKGTKYSLTNADNILAKVNA